ncbi:MAG: hypothetical protein ACP5FL_08990, partial [Thermoplasmatota archaeon]
PDGMKVLYADPSGGYSTDSIMIGEVQGYIPEMTLAGCVNKEHAAIVGTYELKRAWLDRVVTGTFRDDAFKLEPGDIITGTFSALGISGQYFRVVSSGRISADGTVPLTLAYESAELYDDEVNIALADVYTCTLPNPHEVPPGVENVSVSEAVTAYRGRSFIALMISFDQPAGYPWFDHVDVYLSYDNETWEYLYPVRESFEIGNVTEGVTYYVRLKVVSRHGPAQADADDYKISRLITGVSATPPPSVTALEAIINGSTVNLYAAKLITDDNDVYEFRLGTTWTGALFLASNESPNYPLYGVKPGSHTFLINTLGKNGLYGTTPRSATVSLIDPPDGWSVVTGLTTTLDFTAGTHDNTEHTTYNSEDHLMCSHTAGVLTGTWKSAVIDLGSSARRLVYALADIVVTGAGTTMADIFPAGETFADLGMDRTFAEIFALDAAPSVTIKLNYGDTTGVTSQVSRLEILCAEITARYAQIEVTITDPSAAINALVEQMTVKFCTSS